MAFGPRLLIVAIVAAPGDVVGRVPGEDTADVVALRAGLAAVSAGLGIVVQPTSLGAEVVFLTRLRSRAAAWPGAVGILA